MTQKKMVVLFRSVKVAGRATSYHAQPTGRSYWRNITTYDMGSVRDHMLTLTSRDRLLLPETWIVALLLVFPVAGVVALFLALVLSENRAAHTGLTIVALSLFSLAISVWLAYLWSARFLKRKMRQTARKERGSSRAEKLACVRIEDWPQFARRLTRS